MLPDRDEWISLGDAERLKALQECAREPCSLSEEWRDDLEARLRSNAIPDREREAAAIVLGSTSSEGAHETLLALSQESDPRLRQLAMTGLSVWVSEPARERLLDALTDSVNKVRNVAERGLLGYPQEMQTPAVDRLLELLEHEEPLTRSPAARLLGEIGDERALAPLLHMLEHDSEWLGRMWAATALGNLGSGAAVDALTEHATNDPKNRVRAAAITALAQLRPADLSAFLDERESIETDDGALTAIEEARLSLGLEGDAE